MGTLRLILLTLVCLVTFAPIAGAADRNERPFILHLNGIGGERSCDHTLINGMLSGGVDAEVEFYDWTHGDEGIPALHAYEKHKVEAKIIADKLVAVHRANPRRKIYITCHSGGTGLATWALERLPDEVIVESVLMFAPALSPNYDLSKALKHVRTNVFVFNSAFDTVVLSAGTKVFGTIDGVRCEAAGLKGFVKPDKAEDDQYKKLVQIQYEKKWLTKYGNAGSHICAMRTKFAREFVAKVFLMGKAPGAEETAVRQTPVSGEKASAMP
jgi:hypothetical protein